MHTEQVFLECPDCEQPEAVEVLVKLPDHGEPVASLVKVHCGCEPDDAQVEKLEEEAIEWVIEAQ